MRDKRLTVKDLSPDQREVYGGMSSWVLGGKHGEARGPRSNLLRVGGFAGTGKTSILGVFAKELTKQGKLVAYVTYTGRAVSILGRKLAASGVETTSQLRRTSDDAREGWDDYFSDDLDDGGPPLCGTIHKLLYRPVIDPVTEELRGWVKRDQLDREYDLIVVDEASMVSDEILEDILVHGVPLLAVGDHGQLPPVMASGDLMRSPDLRLEKIHRQAEGNPIIALSQLVREGGRFEDFKGWGEEVIRGYRGGHTQEIIDAYASVEDEGPGSILRVGLLCWTNRTRVRLNATARVALKKKGPPLEGEVVMCLKNRPPVFNGMRGVLTEDSTLAPEGNAKPWLLGASVEFPDEGLGADDYLLCAPQFNREKAFESVEELRERGIDVYSMTAAGDYYDFGYALTVHKAQGSQFDHVVLFVDRPEKPWDEEYRRWAYTAVTRASKRLTVLR